MTWRIAIVKYIMQDDVEAIAMTKQERPRPLWSGPFSNSVFKQKIIQPQLAHLQNFLQPLSVLRQSLSHCQA